MVEILKRMWKDACTIQITQETKDLDGISHRVWVPLVENEPCKLSFYDDHTRINSSRGNANANPLFQQTKLFIRPDLDIPEGSRITVVTHKNNKTLYFETSGDPALFTNHQEILIEGVKKWA